MGSIYRRGRIYWLKYYVDGRSLYESARTRDRQEAETQLKQKEVDIAKGLPAMPSRQITFQELT